MRSKSMCYGYIMYTQPRQMAFSISPQYKCHTQSQICKVTYCCKPGIYAQLQFIISCYFFATESLCINTFFALCVSYQFTLKHENPIILSPLNHSHSDIITVVQSYDYWMRWEEIRWDETIKIKLYHHTMTMHVALMECTTINLGSNIRFLPCDVKDKGVWYQLFFLNIGLELTF